MSPDAQALLEKSRRSLDAARALAERHDFDFAISRAYYAMFYAAEAALLQMGYSFSKHSAVIAAFGTHLAKPSLVPQHLHRDLQRAFERRSVADYDTEDVYSDEAADDVLAEAEAFVEHVSRFVKDA